MKILISVLLSFTVLPSLTFAGQTVVTCSSHKTVTGWKGYDTTDKVNFTAIVTGNDTLVDAVISGAYESDKRNLTADKDFVPRHPMYQGYNRFQSLEDAWSWFTPLMPKNISEILPGAKFAGFVQIASEGGNRQTLRLLCSTQIRP